MKIATDLNARSESRYSFAWLEALERQAEECAAAVTARDEMEMRHSHLYDARHNGSAQKIERSERLAKLARRAWLQSLARLAAVQRQILVMAAGINWISPDEVNSGLKENELRDLARTLSTDEPPGPS